MIVVLTSQIFFYLFAFVFIRQWRLSADKRYFSYWIVACPLDDSGLAEVYMFWVLQLPFLVPCAAVTLFKSSQDIIQGVSKLDYLYKVSIFQKYKDEVLQTTKELVLKSTRTAFTSQNSLKSMKRQNLLG